MSGVKENSRGFSAILKDDVQHFIRENLTADLPALLLKNSPFDSVSMSEIVTQIKGLKTAQKKFPFLMKPGIIFPRELNLEQSSSQSTAEYKARTFRGKRFLDLTAGFGIDAFFLSRQFEEVTMVEKDAHLLNIVRHNWSVLDRKADFVNTSLEDFLKVNQQKFDLVYLDPARRDMQKRKRFLLEDLSPNLLGIQAELHEISDHILVKLSPLIDISYLISVLPGISQILILAVKNEVKEVLVSIRPLQIEEEIDIRCVNLESGEPDFNFVFNDIKNAAAKYSEPKRFLYLPNNAVLKAGAFSLISAVFGLEKLAPNTHLYTSDNALAAFPGRVLEVEVISPKELKKGCKFNIISKNHPLSPEEIKKKYKLQDGGSAYLIFTQTQRGKIILKSR